MHKEVFKSLTIYEALSINLLCGVRSDVDIVSACSLEVRSDCESKAVDLHSYPHLWPQAVGSDQKNEIQVVEMSFLGRVSGQSCCSSILKGARWGGLGIGLGSLLRHLWGGIFLSMSFWPKTPGYTQNMLG